jgi:hypothetical protein
MDAARAYTKLADAVDGAEDNIDHHQRKHDVVNGEHLINELI